MSTTGRLEPCDEQAIEYRTGLLRQQPDHRDKIRKYGAGEIPPADRHPTVDLRMYVSKVYAQGNLGSCSANVICAAYRLILNKQVNTVEFKCSRLFNYYNARAFDGNNVKDSGATLRDALKSLFKWGVCREVIWPYEVCKYAKLPPPACYDDAIGNTITRYEAIQQDIHQLRACLKSGLPFLFGYNVYPSLRTLNDAWMLMPSVQEIQSNPNPRGHGGLAVGYDDNIQCITVLNSWGEFWGDKGFFNMPYQYITDPNYAFDFWKIDRALENNNKTVIIDDL